MNAKNPATPFPYKIANQLPLSPNALLDVSDDELTSKYQRLVGCLMYLAIATHPDIAYYAMWLGCFSAKPTHSHMLIAKHVLCYLGGTKLLAVYHHLSHLKHYVDICKTWDVLMLIGHQIL